MNVKLNRREFLKSSGVLGASLVVGFNAAGALAVAGEHNSADLNAFVRVGDDDTVTVIAKHFEMGQGTTTGLPVNFQIYSHRFIPLVTLWRPNDLLNLQ